MVHPKIRPRERDTIIQALRAGVVPRLGLQHIQVAAQEKSPRWSAMSSGSTRAVLRSAS